MNRPWLKAGLIGSGIMLLLNVLGVIPLPFMGCFTLLLEIIAFIGVGALAARWLPPPRTTGQAAGHGALAGLIMGVIGALITTLLAPLAYSLSGGSNAVLSALPPETLNQLEMAGVDPALLFGGGTMAGVTAICCFPAGALIGAALGALGGLIYASVNPGVPPAPLSVDDWTQLPPPAA
jgi:hypothetical protein